MSGYSGDTDYSAGILPGTTQNADPFTAGVAGSAGVTLGTGTGSQGHAPIAGGSMSDDPFIEVWQWLNRPFSTALSPYTLFLMVGTVIIGVIIWNLILYHIRIAAETI